MTRWLKDCLRSLAGYQERPHFLLEFAPGGSRHQDLVTDKPEQELRADKTSSRLTELPNKMEEFLEVIYWSTPTQSYNWQILLGIKFGLSGKIKLNQSKPSDFWTFCPSFIEFSLRNELWYFFYLVREQTIFWWRTGVFEKGRSQERFKEKEDRRR